MNCSECQGTGQVKIPSYRDNAKPEKKVPPTNRWNNFKIYCVRTLKLLLAASISFAVIYSIRWEIISNVAAETKTRATEAKQGYLIAQYNDANQVERCWIAPHKDADVSVIGKGVIIFVKDVNDTQIVANSIGLADVSKCVKFTF